MTHWPGKYVIGLTGNIATGKSIVRRMLEYLGAFGIDADALAHRSIAKGAPGFQQVLDSFGESILNTEGQIDRSLLAQIVFSDRIALRCLETIIHPLVSLAIHNLIENTSYKTIVVEAIKLIESGLSGRCDSLWVTTAPGKLQLERLITDRGMSRSSALQRINAQPPQKEKIDAADFVIHNDGTYENTWFQVKTALQKDTAQVSQAIATFQPLSNSSLTISHLNPDQTSRIVQALSLLDSNRSSYLEKEIMLSFMQKSYFMISKSNKDICIASLQMDDFVGVVDNLHFSPNSPSDEILTLLIQFIESYVFKQFCEILLIKIQDQNKVFFAAFNTLGYNRMKVQELETRVQQTIPNASYTESATIYAKSLNQLDLLWNNHHLHKEKH